MNSSVWQDALSCNPYWSNKFWITRIVISHNATQKFIAADKGKPTSLKLHAAVCNQKCVIAKPFTDFGCTLHSHDCSCNRYDWTVTVLQSQHITPACSSHDFTCLCLSRHILFTPAGHPRTFCVLQLQLVSVLWGLPCFLAAVCNIPSCLISIGHKCTRKILPEEPLTHIFLCCIRSANSRGDEKRDKTRSFINKMFSSGIKQNRCSTDNFVYLQL